MEPVSNTFHSADVIPKPSLSTTPVEILRKIAKLVAQDKFASSDSRKTLPDLQYTTNNGEHRRYRPWSLFLHEVRRCPGVSRQLPKYKNKSILSLLVTCVLICRACVAVLYHKAVVHSFNHQQLYMFMETITKNESAFLQQYVTHLAVTYDSYWEAERREFRRTQSIQNTLASESGWLQQYVTRVAVAFDFSPYYDVESERRDLRRAKSIQNILASGGRPATGIAQPGSHPEEQMRLRSLARAAAHTPCVGAFEPVRDTLESLVWVITSAYHQFHYGERPDITCLRQLRHLATGARISIPDTDWGATLWEEEDIVCMESLETVEVITRRQTRREAFKSLRVEDLRYFEKWQFGARNWKRMKDEFLDAAMREYKQLGIHSSSLWR
ncbi:uncharacterized protein LY79DRAFT_593933 [Colletotrichum navitas]|uniref:Uncharacterized protein n=1 Tax=Colletotrichum navitas TaxID=681940 RepID=A0AAD8PNL8_9PEZI|nr:uncharacterized protein LY79DRAFT_593933 [Colletotrichum navitas]KAK1573457.1 hypothetical protein LY79DRAFT_593933 [Colletotrichum navitas]